MRCVIPYPKESLMSSISEHPGGKSGVDILILHTVTTCAPLIIFQICFRCTTTIRLLKEHFSTDHIAVKVQTNTGLPKIRELGDCAKLYHFNRFSGYENWVTILMICFPHYPQSRGKVEMAVEFAKKLM